VCYLLGVEVVEVVLDELDGGSEVGLVELVRYVPADRSELATLLDGRVKERHGVQQRLPLRHRHDVDEILTDDSVRSLQTGLHPVWSLRRVLDRRLYIVQTCMPRKVKKLFFFSVYFATFVRDICLCHFLITVEKSGNLSLSLTVVLASYLVSCRLSAHDVTVYYVLWTFTL